MVRASRGPLVPPARLLFLSVPAAPDIRPFFLEGLWQAGFEEESLAAGARLKGRVRQAHGRWEKEQLFLRAEVGGEMTEIVIWAEGSRWSFESNCSCDLRVACPHAAALFFAASRPAKLDPLLAGGREPLRPASDLGPAEEQDDLVLSPEFHLEIVRELTTSRVVRLLLQALRIRDEGDWVLARPYVRYGTHRFPLTSKPGPRVQSLGGGLQLRRDAGAEMNAILQLQQTGLGSLGSSSQFRFLLALEQAAADADQPPAGIWFPDPEHGPIAEFWPWLRATGAARLAARGWTVNFAPDVGHEVIETDPDAFRYVLEDEGGGWFHLSVGFDVNGRELDLLPILAGLIDRGAAEESLEFPATGNILYHLPDGRALSLPAERIRRILRQFSAFLDPRRFHGRKMRLHPLDAAALALSDPASFTPPAGLEKLVSALRDPASGPASPVPLPGGLRAKLRDYQKTGFYWMQFLARYSLGGILADDMGLGKTLQTLAHILAERQAAAGDGDAGNLAPALVVAPTSVVSNWVAEARKFTPDLRPLVLEGPQRRRYFRSIPHADLVLTSYALLQRDIAELARHHFSLVVLDEAQYIKNPAAKVTRAACQLDARLRLCLSGTPVENHLGELWSQLHFLMPGFLGGQEDFNRRFRKPVESGSDPDRLAALKARVAPLILRRTKDQVATELPPKTILIHPIELNTAQKDLYETVRATMDKRVRQAIAASGLQGAGMLFLEALLKLRQICCEPRLLGIEGDSRQAAQAAGSAKLDYLFELLDSLLQEGRRILLFSQFTSMLDLIAARLRKQRIPWLQLTGASKNRGELVERFQSGGVPLFLISLKAGGTGLNLTAADTVIHYDPWWNPAVEIQATDRAYRIGQTRPVFVHKLICQGTVEERIHQLQQQKSRLASEILSGSDQPKRLTPALLQSLLGEGPSGEL